MISLIKGENLSKLIQTYLVLCEKQLPILLNHDLTVINLIFGKLSSA